MGSASLENGWLMFFLTTFISGINVFQQQTPSQDVIRVNKGVSSQTSFILFHAA